jgi:hypothetical protein
MKGKKSCMTKRAIELFAGIGLVLGAGVGLLMGHLVIGAGVGLCLGAGIGAAQNKK